MNLEKVLIFIFLEFFQVSNKTLDSQVAPSSENQSHDDGNVLN